jgi:hypothetical protein
MTHSKYEGKSVSKLEMDIEQTGAHGFPWNQHSCLFISNVSICNLLTYLRTTHKIFSSQMYSFLHDSLVTTVSVTLPDLPQLRTFRDSHPPRTVRELTSDSPTNPWSDKREKGTTVLLLTPRVAGVWRHCRTRRWRGPSLLLCYTTVYSCRLATGIVFSSALCSNGRGAENTAFLYCCVIAVVGGPAYELPEQIRHSIIC